MNQLTYKGYTTKIEVDTESGVLYGKIESISDLINFESESLKEIETEFHNAVDDYLEFCQKMGKEPEKPFKGSFNVRIDPDLHRRAAMRAAKNNESLNAFVEKAIAEKLDASPNGKIVFNFIATSQKRTEKSESLWDQSWQQKKFYMNYGTKAIIN